MTARKPKPDGTPATIGRPLKSPPEAVAARVRDLAALGCSIANISARLGTTFKTFQRWRAADENIDVAFMEGREAERHALHNRMYRLSMEGEEKTAFNATRFLLSARHGYVEGGPDEHGSRTNVVINLPGALQPAQYLATINDRRNDRAVDSIKPLPAAIVRGS